MMNQTEIDVCVMLPHSSIENVKFNAHTLLNRYKFVKENDKVFGNS